jgi:hypothetical protein
MKKKETYENVAFGWLGIVICLLIAGLYSCTDEFYDNTTILNAVTELTIEGDKDTTTINIGGTTINPADITINEGGTTVNEGDITVNVSPPNLTFNYAFTNNTVDSSKMFVHVDGSNLQTGDILISANNTNSNSNSNINQDTTNINNVNNNNNDVNSSNTNSLVNGITINTDNTLTIESTVEQESCPYTQEKCIIKNCKFHHCSEYSKNHPKHKCN